MSLRLKLTACFILAILGARFAGVAAQFAVTTNSVFVLSTRDEARQVLAAEDDFTRALSAFDRAARAKSEDVCSNEFLKFVAGEALAWTERDIARLAAATAEAKNKLAAFKLPLPS